MEPLPGLTSFRDWVKETPSDRPPAVPDMGRPGKANFPPPAVPAPGKGQPEPPPKCIAE